ncbi:MAG: protein translocase SEC61 complex subunit gamma [Euryarchaeota archaeon]|nr:protein translocase SEC61 complex subunit gamma [Euryarchaeota archaeon]
MQERELKTPETRSIVDKAWDVQYRIENRAKQVGKGRYGRVIKMARKPDSDEFRQVAKVTGIGIVVVGFIGFLIFFLMGFTLPWLGKVLGF